MRPVLLVFSILLASAMFGYGFASAQSTGALSGTPTTASHPYTAICGNHPCKPGEIYTPGGSNTTTEIGANGTAAPMSTHVSISANVTIAKITNGTMKSPISKSLTATTPVTAPKTPQPSALSPEKQFDLGVPPADIQCPSGYQLVLNKFDQRPGCVTAEVAVKLVERGWAAG